MSLVRFNSIRALAFLTWSLAPHTISPYSSHATCACLHPLSASLLCLSFSRISLFIHGGLLVFLPDILFVGMHHSWTWRLDFLGPSSLQAFLPRYSTEQIPEEAKVCSADVQGSELAVRPAYCTKDFEPHHFMVTAAKATLALHIPHQSLLAGENNVQHSTSICGLLYHLEE